MNWLIGSRATEAPETPVHRWAFNAFKGVIMPETPYPTVQMDTDRRASATHGAPSILKTPGTAASRKLHNVKFHRSVQSKTNRFSRSGLPQDFPGKFPSPWVSKSDNMDDAESLDNDIMDQSPISIQKDARERPPTATMNPLKRLSLQLNPERSPVQVDKPKSSPRRPGRKSMQALHWDVEQGFEEVLASISKNNIYLQKLIDEMQESCSQVDESFAFESADQNPSDVTINLKEPRSRSGRYWHAKFQDFSALTAKVKTEQNNMERALTKLREEVDLRDLRSTENWKDKYDILKEEFDKLKQVSKNGSQTRELRDLRKQVKDIQQVVRERDDLKAQLTIADLQILDLQQRLDRQTAASDGKVDGTISSEVRKSTVISKQSLGNHSPVKTAVTPATSKRVPQSATARRLAAATAKMEAESQVKQSTVTMLERASLPISKEEPATRGALSKDEERRPRHGRFGSRTTTTFMDSPVSRPVNKSNPVSTFQFDNFDGKTTTANSLAPLREQATKYSNFRPAQESPRPLFATLDVNKPFTAPMAKSTSTFTSTMKKVEARVEASDDVGAKLEAVKRRTEARKAERAKKMRAQSASIRG